jgi:hypothetical protein
VTTARDAAQWRGPDEVWLDHATLREADLAWLTPVRTLTLWAVRVPPGLLAALPGLAHLDVRGGSGTSVDVAAGCAGLRSLRVNQVRGVTDLSVVAGLTTLELLSLYGMPRVAAVPSLAALTALRRVEVGSMKGLEGLTGVHDARGLEELWLVNDVRLAPDDAARLAAHPTLREVAWDAPDVPLSTTRSFLDRVALPRARGMHVADWFAARA